jgi:SNF2 family DNA or RNA helicase
MLAFLAHISIIYDYWARNQRVVCLQTYECAGWELKLPIPYVERLLRSTVCRVDFVHELAYDDDPNKAYQRLSWHIKAWNGQEEVSLAWKWPTISDTLLDAKCVQLLGQSAFLEQQSWMEEGSVRLCQPAFGKDANSTHWFIRASLSSETTANALTNENSTFKLDLLYNSQTQLRPCKLLKTLLSSFVSLQRVPNFTFSPNILYEPVRASCSSWKNMAERPKGLAEVTKSLGYQLRSLDWMMAREQGKIGAHCHIDSCKEEYDCLWVELRSGWFYSPSLNRISDQKDELVEIQYSEPRGGVLSDEMGLGKTVEVISLVLSNRYPKNIYQTANKGNERSVRTASANHPPALRLQSCFCHQKEAQEAFILNSPWIQCPYCDNWQHTVCMEIDFRHPDPLYACPNCGSQPVISSLTAVPTPDIGFVASTDGDAPPATNTSSSAPSTSSAANGYQPSIRDSRGHNSSSQQANPRRVSVDLPTTLIVCPDSILPQWESELNRHIAPGHLKYMVFDGESDVDLDRIMRAKKDKEAKPDLRPRICRAEQFRDYDIIITTYSILRDALRRKEAADGQRKLARRNQDNLRYLAFPSPLIGATWYRVCFDESQMLSDGGTEAAILAQQLRIRHRWAVSGTPISRGLNDLLGIILFLDIQPYSDRKLWRTAVLEPALEGNKAAIKLLRSLLTRIMWRSEKADVNEVDMPGLEEFVHKVQFTEVETYMYRRRWTYCESKLQELKTKQQKGSLNERQIHKFINDLLILRLACCHHQLGQQSGLKSLADGVMSGSDVLKELVAQARVQAEDKQRNRVYYLNGLAALSMAEKRWMDAADFYRKVLDFGDVKIDVDQGPLLHARHNLIEAIERIAEGIQDQETLDQLNAEISRLAIENKEFVTTYTANARNRFVAAAVNYASQAKKISEIEPGPIVAVDIDPTVPNPSTEAKTLNPLLVKVVTLRLGEWISDVGMDDDIMVSENGRDLLEYKLDQDDFITEVSVFKSQFLVGLSFRTNNGKLYGRETLATRFDHKAPAGHALMGFNVARGYPETDRTALENFEPIWGPSHIKTTVPAVAPNAPTDFPTEQTSEATQPTQITEQNTSISFGGPGSASTSTGEYILGTTVAISSNSMDIYSPFTAPTATSSQQTPPSYDTSSTEAQFLGEAGRKVAQSPSNRLRKQSPSPTNATITPDSVSTPSPAFVAELATGRVRRPRTPKIPLKPEPTEEDCITKSQLEPAQGRKSSGFFSGDVPTSKRVPLEFWILNNDAWWRVALAVLDERHAHAFLQDLQAEYSRVKVVNPEHLQTRASLIAYLRDRLELLLDTKGLLAESLVAMCGGVSIAEVPDNPPEPAWKALMRRSDCTKCRKRQMSKSKPKHAKRTADMKLEEEEERLCCWCLTEKHFQTFNALLTNYRDTGYLSILTSLMKYMQSCARETGEEKMEHLTVDLVRELNEAASASMKAIDLLKREATLADRLCSMHLEYSKAGDEINMFVTRVRLIDDIGGDEPRYEQALITRQELVANIAEYTAGLKAAQFEYQEQISQLKYLMKQMEGNSSDSCPICWEQLPSQIMMLSCGHSGCPDCFTQALEVNGKCPLCRARVRSKDDRKIVARDPSAPSDNATWSGRTPTAEEINAKNWGSKIEQVVALVQQEMESRPGEKFLVFSNWSAVLTLVDRALKDAGIASLSSAQGGGMATAMDRFRADPAVTVLLLPLTTGSKGANLTCASQIIFVDPTLLAATEAQAVGRIHRIGQTRTMKIHRFYVEQSIEQSIYELFCARKHVKTIDSNAGYTAQEQEKNTLMDVDLLEKLLYGKPIAGLDNQMQVDLD